MRKKGEVMTSDTKRKLFRVWLVLAAFYVVPWLYPTFVATARYLRSTQNGVALDELTTQTEQAFAEVQKATDAGASVLEIHNLQVAFFALGGQRDSLRKELEEAKSQLYSKVFFMVLPPLFFLVLGRAIVWAMDDSRRQSPPKSPPQRNTGRRPPQSVADRRAVD
jgi:hypothetical protein